MLNITSDKLKIIRKETEMRKIDKSGDRSVEKSDSKGLVPIEVIENKIFVIRGQKVIIDKDLAALYGVSTKRLNEQVKRNHRRFPLDFMFRLSKIEADVILGVKEHSRSQFATLKKGQNIKYLPYVFTEQGVAMLSGILNSNRAIIVNIVIMRAFVKLRQMISNNKEFAQKLAELEHKFNRHDDDIIAIFNAIRQLMKEDVKPKAKIGFV